MACSMVPQSEDFLSLLSLGVAEPPGGGRGAFRFRCCDPQEDPGVPLEPSMVMVPPLPAPTELSSSRETALSRSKETTGVVSRRERSPREAAFR